MSRDLITTIITRTETRGRYSMCERMGCEPERKLTVVRFSSKTSGSVAFTQVLESDWYAGAVHCFALNTVQHDHPQT